MDKLDLILEKIEDHKENVDLRLGSIDTNLAEHMRRTDVLEKLHIDNQDRLQVLEEPRIALKIVKSVLLYVGAIIGTILGLIKFAEYLK